MWYQECYKRTLGDISRQAVGCLSPRVYRSGQWARKQITTCRFTIKRWVGCCVREWRWKGTRKGDREAKTRTVTIAGQLRKVIKKMLGGGSSKDPRAEELEIAQGEARVQCLKTVRGRLLLERTCRSTVSEKSVSGVSTLRRDHRERWEWQRDLV